MKQCCICGKMLPNKYAIGGACEHPNCTELFCRYHWDKGHRKCLAHGGSKEITVSTEQSQPKESIPMKESNTSPETPKTKSSGFFSKIASGVKSIKKAIVKDPEEELKKAEDTLQQYEVNRSKLVAELEQVDRQIIEKKKQYNVAPPFKKSILKSELERLLSLHSNYERRIKAILNNEKALSNYVSRVNEMGDIKNIPINEANVDKLTDRLETAVDDSMSIGDAVKDLNKVKGVSPDSMDEDDFDSMLDMFGEEVGEDIPQLDDIIGAQDALNTDESNSNKNLEQPLKG